MLKKLIKTILISLLFITSLTSSVSAEKRKYYILDVNNISEDTKRYITSVVIEDETHNVYINNVNVGTITSDPQKVSLITTNYNITATISLKNLTCNISVDAKTQKNYKSLFKIELENNEYYVCYFYPDSENSSYYQKQQSSRNGDIHTFGGFSYKYSDEDTKSYTVKMIQSTGAVYINDDYITTLDLKSTPVVFEYISEDFPLSTEYVDYASGSLSKYTWADASQTNRIFYNRQFSDIAIKQNYNLENEYLNLPSVQMTFGADVNYYKRVEGTSESGTGVWESQGTKIAVVCEYYEDNQCGTAIRKEFPRYWAVFPNSLGSIKQIDQEQRELTIAIEEKDQESDTVPTSGEISNLKYSYRTANWSDWTDWTEEARPNLACSGGNCRAESGKFYRYRTYTWVDVNDWSTTDKMYGEKTISKTGEFEECGQYIKWYDYADFGSASKTTYGETGGCNTYYGPSDVCGKEIKWYEYSNYGSASASTYGETGGCNSYYGASSVCGYKSCANSACGYNTCEAQACGYATCTSASACGYKSCRTSACGSESYVSSNNCAQKHSKTCYKDESYSCTKTTSGANCSKCGSTTTCKRCYVGSSMETNCSYCGSTSTCKTCSYSVSSTCTRSVSYDCSYTTYDGPCYSTRYKECKSSDCGANTCTSSSCGYKTCADSSCGAKTCTTSACGNKECTWYTCPSTKTPVYENKECTWYTCPSTKTPVYGNNTCTLYKNQNRSYSDWSSYSYKDGCPYLSGANVDCGDYKVKYRYQDRSWSNWSNWIATSSSMGNNNVEKEYKYKYDIKVEGKQNVAVATDNERTWKNTTNVGKLTYNEVEDWQVDYARHSVQGTAYIDTTPTKDKVTGMSYRLWDDYQESVTNHMPRALHEIQNEKIYSPYLYFWAWRFINANFDLPSGTAQKYVNSYDAICYLSNGNLIVNEETISRETKIIYYDYRDPLANYSEIPENWKGYESLLNEIENSDMSSYKVKVKISGDDLIAMKKWIKDNPEKLNDGSCAILREFSYIFVGLNDEMSKWLASGEGCSAKEATKPWINQSGD